MKKLFVIIAVAIITLTLFIPIASAEEYIQAPLQNREPLYQILNTAEAEPNPYIVYGYDSTNITIIDEPQAFLRHFFPDADYNDEGNYVRNYYVDMYSSRGTYIRSRLNMFINASNQITVYYEVFNPEGNIDFQHLIVSLNSTYYDFAIIASDDGSLYLYLYDTRTDEPLYDRQGGYLLPLTYVFYGDMYLYGRLPNSVNTELINNARQEGYQEGVKDATPTEEEIQEFIDIGYNDGFDKGLAKGLKDGMSLDNESVLNQGISIGQGQANIIPQAINGFWNSMMNFFQPFLSIGIGSLTLYNVLAIMIVVGVVLIIIKMTR